MYSNVIPDKFTDIVTAALEMYREAVSVDPKISQYSINDIDSLIKVLKVLKDGK